MPNIPQSGVAFVEGPDGIDVICIDGSVVRCDERHDKDDNSCGDISYWRSFADHSNTSVFTCYGC